jgi:hypothetical protein
MKSKIDSKIGNGAKWRKSDRELRIIIVSTLLTRI